MGCRHHNVFVQFIACLRALQFGPFFVTKKLFTEVSGRPFPPNPIPVLPFLRPPFPEEAFSFTVLH